MKVLGAKADIIASALGESSRAGWRRENESFGSLKRTGQTEQQLNPCQFPSPDSSPTGGGCLPPTNTDGANYSKKGERVSSRGSQGVDGCGIMGSGGAWEWHVRAGEGWSIPPDVRDGCFC